MVGIKDIGQSSAVRRRLVIQGQNFMQVKGKEDSACHLCQPFSGAPPATPTHTPPSSSLSLSLRLSPLSKDRTETERVAGEGNIKQVGLGELRCIKMVGRGSSSSGGLEGEQP